MYWWRKTILWFWTVCMLMLLCIILNPQPPPQQDPAILSYQRSPSSNLLPSTNGNRETGFVEKLLVSHEYLVFQWLSHFVLFSILIIATKEMKFLYTTFDTVWKFGSDTDKFKKSLWLHVKFYTQNYQILMFCSIPMDLSSVVREKLVFFSILANIQETSIQWK